MHLLIHGQKRHCDNIAAALQPSPLNGHQNETYDGAKLHQIGAICAPNKNDKNANRESEMYPLYWTPSKEGTFCVIRLNLS